MTQEWLFATGEYVKHLKSGAVYYIHEHARLEASGDYAYVYSLKDQPDAEHTWVRAQEEMEDGRFMVFVPEDPKDVRIRELEAHVEGLRESKRLSEERLAHATQVVCELAGTPGWALTAAAARLCGILEDLRKMEPSPEMRKELRRVFMHSDWGLDELPHCLRWYNETGALKEPPP